MSQLQQHENIGIRLEELMKRLLRPIFNKIASLLGIPRIHDRLNKLEEWVAPNGPGTDLFTLMERRLTDLVMSQVFATREEINSTALHVENRLVSLNEALVSYIDAKQQQNRDSIDDFVRQQSAVISDLRQSIDTIRRLANGTSQTTHPQSQCINNNATGTTPNIIL